MTKRWAPFGHTEIVQQVGQRFGMHQPVFQRDMHYLLRRLIE